MEVLTCWLWVGVDPLCLYGWVNPAGLKALTESVGGEFVPTIKAVVRQMFSFSFKHVVKDLSLLLMIHSSDSPSLLGCPVLFEKKDPNFRVCDSLVYCVNN